MFTKKASWSEEITLTIIKLKKIDLIKIKFVGNPLCPYKKFLKISDTCFTANNNISNLRFNLNFSHCLSEKHGNLQSGEKFESNKYISLFPAIACLCQKYKTYR